MALRCSSNGVLEKIKEGNYIYKDSMYAFTKEPIAEYICSKILNYIGLNHVDYFLIESMPIKYNSRVWSGCRYIEGVIPVYKLMFTDDEYAILDILDRSDLVNMFTFDALVDNPDRHLGNIHVLYNNVLILDNGQALDSMNNFENAETSWRSNPLEPFHDDQLGVLNIRYDETFLNWISIDDIISIVYSLDLKKYITERQIDNITGLIRYNYKRLMNLNWR